MVIKLYISRISGNKEVKKKQQRVQMILDSKQIDYEAIDITEPGKEKEKEFMQQNGKVRESLGKYPLPPQIFNDDDFCGDYEDFDMANEVDELEKFLHMATYSKNVENESKKNEENQISEDKINLNKSSNPFDYHTFKIKWENVNGFQEQNSDINKEKDKEHKEDVEKSEVNGEVETSSKSKSENFYVSETNEEIVAPVQEEVQEEKQSIISDNDKNDKMDTEDNVISHKEEEENKKSENLEENVGIVEKVENENDEAEEKPQNELFSVEKEEIVDNNINEVEEIHKEKSVNKESDDDEDDNSSSQSEKSEED